MPALMFEAEKRGAGRMLGTRPHGKLNSMSCTLGRLVNGPVPSEMLLLSPAVALRVGETPALRSEVRNHRAKTN
jgi:hypothetical protein